jgi:cell filamentation protein
LIDTPLSGEFDLARLKAIHRYIFQDVYEWADGSLFGLANFLEPSLQQVLTNLAAEKHLANLDADTFAGRAAYFLGELNAAHPFREGVGKSDARNGHVPFEERGRELMKGTRAMMPAMPSFS